MILLVGWLLTCRVVDSVLVDGSSRVLIAAMATRRRTELLLPPLPLTSGGT